MNATILLVAMTISNATIPDFYQQYGGVYPQGRTIHVCHGNGCPFKVKYVFTRGDIAVFRGLLSASQTPAEERKSIAWAIGWADRRTCARTKLCGDPGGTGGWVDCTSSATNVSSFLVIMQPYMRYHRVIPPLHRMKWFAWPHWSSRVKDTLSGKNWMIDSYFRKNGAKPIIMTEEKWLR